MVNYGGSAEFAVVDRAGWEYSTFFVASLCESLLPSVAKVFSTDNGYQQIASDHSDAEPIK